MINVVVFWDEVAAEKTCKLSFPAQHKVPKIDVEPVAVLQGAIKAPRKAENLLTPKIMLQTSLFSFFMKTIKQKLRQKAQQ